MRVRLSAEADRDLTGIFRYGRTHWGRATAAAYLRSIDADFARLARSPRIGSPLDAPYDGYRRLRHRSHILFYRIGADDILILRILHHSMDVERHLS